MAQFLPTLPTRGAFTNTPSKEELMIAIRDAREANPGMGTKALAELFRRERGWQVDNVRAVLR